MYFLSSHELDLVNNITDSIYTIRNKKLLKYNKSKSVQYTIIFDEYTDTDCFRNKKSKSMKMSCKKANGNAAKRSRNKRGS